MGEEELESTSRRWFVAIELPGYVAEAVERIREGAADPAGITWVQREKLHVTLAFLGQVDRERRTALVERLGEAVVNPFLIGLEGLGVFPGKGRPQVLWAGLAPVGPVLFQLRGKLEQLLLGLGVEPDLRRYHPHVTIARCSSGGGAAALRLVSRHRDFGTAPFWVDGFTLFSSQPTATGLRYACLRRVNWKS
jgi:2'-5' RNA ligase